MIDETVKKDLKAMPFYTKEDSLLIIHMSEYFPDKLGVYVSYTSKLLSSRDNTFISFTLKPEINVCDNMFIRVSEEHRNKGIASEFIDRHGTICRKVGIQISRFPKKSNYAPGFWKKKGYVLDGDFYRKDL